MGKKLELEPGERILEETSRFMLQGRGKLKYPVHAKCIITDRRFVYFDMGKMTPFYLQLGILIKLLVKGTPVSMPLSGLMVGRGKYYKNKKILELKTLDGTSVFLDRFEKSLDWFRGVLQNNGISLSQTGEEEWHIL